MTLYPCLLSVLFMYHRKKLLRLLMCMHHRKRLLLLLLYVYHHKRMLLLRFSRFASAFSRSPWGPRRLCTPHYVKVFQHRSLDLENFPEEPNTAINPSANTEIQYLERILAKVRRGEQKLCVSSCLCGLVGGWM